MADIEVEITRNKTFFRPRADMPTLYCKQAGQRFWVDEEMFDESFMSKVSEEPAPEPVEDDVVSTCEEEVSFEEDPQISEEEEEKLLPSLEEISSWGVAKVREYASDVLSLSLRKNGKLKTKKQLLTEIKRIREGEEEE